MFLFVCGSKNKKEGNGRRDVIRIPVLFIRWWRMYALFSVSGIPDTVAAGGRNAGNWTFGVVVVVGEKWGGGGLLGVNINPTNNSHYLYKRVGRRALICPRKDKQLHRPGRLGSNHLSRRLFSRLQFRMWSVIGGVPSPRHSAEMRFGKNPIRFNCLELASVLNIAVNVCVCVCVCLCMCHGQL